MDIHLLYTHRTTRRSTLLCYVVLILHGILNTEGWSASSLSSSISSSCPVIFEHARLECEEPGTGRASCEENGCCWDPDADTPRTQCYKRECAPGFFGWGCRFECQCEGGEKCDRYSGQCPNGCPPSRWGIGCLLDNECTYNDDFAHKYMGRKGNTTSGKECLAWTAQKAYPGNQFPDKSLVGAGHHCRNPQPTEHRTWCYIRKSRYKSNWEYCVLSKCNCMPGRFGINCDHECHCADEYESCDGITGHCQSECDFRWTGMACQECADGWFGEHCDHPCRCRREGEVCNNITGKCDSGCQPGWTESSNCQEECADGWFGYNCEFRCNCRNTDETCNKNNGNCYTGCREGFSGPGCQIQMPRLRHPPKLRNRTATELTVYWTAWNRNVDLGTGGVSHYILIYADYGSDQEHRLSPDGLSYTIHGLEKDTLYWVTVIPVHEQNFEGLPSPALNVSTCATPLSGPRDVEYEELTSSSTWEHSASTPSDSEDDDDHTKQPKPQDFALQLTWNNPDKSQWGCDDISYYHIYIRPGGLTGSASSYNRYRRVSAIQQSVEVSSVDAYSNLSIAVSMENSAGLESEMTAVNYVGKSGIVRNLHVEPTKNSVNVTWEAPEQSNGPVTLYIVRYKLLRIGNCEATQISWNPWEVVDFNEPWYHIPDVFPYTKFKVRVWARTEAGEGMPLTITYTTQATVPLGSVQNIRVTSIEATVVSFAWEAPECMHRNGEFVGYNYILTRTTPGQDDDDYMEDDEPLVAQHRILTNSSELRLEDLVPFTNYKLQVAFVNHEGEGPMNEALHFSTLEGRPPAPSDFMVSSKLSHSLSVEWSAPDPPHGVIRTYELKYWSKDIIQDPRRIDIPADQTTYFMDNLDPNTTFGLQVRAKTNAGAGDWSPVLNAFTEETYPSEPQFLTNVSRTPTSIELSWQAPVKLGGLLKNYKIECSPRNPLAAYLKHKSVVREVSAGTLTYQVDDLEPGSMYRCELMARTNKGYGPATAKTFWTEPKIFYPPPSPKLDASQNTDSTIVLTLVPDDATLSASTESANSFYQIVVQILNSSPSRLRRSAVAITHPCGIEHGDLLPYEEAMEHGDACYVVAEIPPPSREIRFVVGDNRTYGRYHNPPLRKGQEYNVFVGLIVTVDGVTIASYSRTETPIVAESSHVPSSSEANSNTAMLAGAAVGAIAIVLIILLIAIFIIRKKKHRPHRESNGSAGKPENTELFSAPTVKVLDGKQNGTGKSVSVVENQYGSSSEEDGGDDERMHLFKEEEDTIPSKPICVDDLWNYIKEMKANSGLQQEYETLPHNLRYSCKVARQAENKNKNRYGNIVAYDHSRVILEPLEDDPHSDYINANYIDAYRRPDAWIAMQGPSKFTINDIWRLAWQKNSHRIVMVTNLVEDGRHKCEQYWPDVDGGRTYGDIHVEKVETEQYADFTIRIFTLTKDGEGKTLRQFHFTAWPDHGVPMYATSLLAFRKKIRSFDDPTSGQSIIHCSAGVGRTGTLIALDYLLDQAKVEGQVDVRHFVHSMRTKRVNMVQTFEQYMFVYDALIEALMSGETSIPCIDFRKAYLQLQEVNPETDKLRLQEEYELLQLLSPVIEMSGCKEALAPANAEKNRCKTILPLDNLNRAFLITYVPGSSDYINAVFVDGYKQQDAFLVTQQPMPDTLVDFWAMCYDHDCRTIIMMNNTDQMDKSCAVYYPDESKSQQYGPFKVETVKCDSMNPDFTVRHITLVNTKRSTEVRLLRQFQYHGWKAEDDLPHKMTSLISLLQRVEKWQQSSNNGRIVVHCMDGATRSGLYCSVSYLVERLKLEQEVDVFHSVKHTRINRPQIIPTLAQYKFLYDMAVEYMDCFETYANFK